MVIVPVRGIVPCLDIVGRDMVGRDIVGLDIVGLDIVGRDIVGRDIVGRDIVGRDIDPVYLALSVAYCTNYGRILTAIEIRI